MLIGGGRRWLAPSPACRQALEGRTPMLTAPTSTLSMPRNPRASQRKRCEKISPDGITLALSSPSIVGRSARPGVTATDSPRTRLGVRRKAAPDARHSPCETDVPSPSPTASPHRCRASTFSRRPKTITFSPRRRTLFGVGRRKRSSSSPPSPSMRMICTP